MFFVDSHCHLDQLNYCNCHKNLLDVLNKAKIHNVGLILSVSITLENFSNMVNFIGYRKDVLFSCGVHPLYIGTSYNFNDLLFLSSGRNVIALGETGLDYYHHGSNKIQQRQVFQDHIDIACQQEKPIIVHSRSARDDTLSILRENKFAVKGVLHCFTENKDMAKALLDLNFYISFSGIITFKNSEYLRSVINYIPLNRILLESDAPYLSPMPYRGTENQPAYVYNTAKYLANIKSISLDELSRVTTLNFMNLFQLDCKKYCNLQN